MYKLLFAVFLSFACLSAYAVDSTKPEEQKTKAIQKEAKKQAKKEIKKASVVEKNVFVALENTNLIPFMSNYIEELEKEVSKNYKSPLTTKSYTVKTVVVIDKNGGVIASNLKSNSTLRKDLEEDAMNAIKKSAPFKPFPEGYQGVQETFEFTFKPVKRSFNLL